MEKPAGAGLSPASGVLIVDKPPDVSSARVIHRVKQALRARKAGHAGTLDPFATGVLVCCINQATRLADFFLKSEKTYRGVLALGAATDTQDATGKVVSTGNPRGIGPDHIREVFSTYTGDLQQQPPVYSALKHQGVPLYKLARRGEPVQKPARRVHVRRLEMLSMEGSRVHFEVTCTAGTYVRTLCADIGSALGCQGHLNALCRLKSGGFTLAEAVGPAEFEELALSGDLAGRMLTMADALRGMPGCVADAALTHKILCGMPLDSRDFDGAPEPIPAGFFKVVDRSNRLIAVLNRRNDLKTYDYRCVFPN